MVWERQTQSNQIQPNQAPLVPVRKDLVANHIYGRDDFQRRPHILFPRNDPLFLFRFSSPVAVRWWPRAIGSALAPSGRTFWQSAKTHAQAPGGRAQAPRVILSDLE